MADQRFYPKPLGPFTLAEAAKICRAELPKNAPQDYKVYALKTLDEATNKEVAFLTRLTPEYLSKLSGTRAKAVIIDPKHRDKLPPDSLPLLSSNPHLAMTLLMRAFYPIERLVKYPTTKPKLMLRKTLLRLAKGLVISKGAVIHTGVKLGKNCRIGANSVILPGVSIGDNVTIGANSTIGYAEIGSNACIGNNVSIGSAGFGFTFDADAGRYLDIPHLGIVRIGDFAVLGDNVSVARGSSKDTVIHEHARIDNLVQIAHNVEIGPYTAVAAQAGFAGSTVVGSGVQVGGQAGFAGHIHIGDKSIVGAQAGVAGDVDGGAVVMGTPAIQQKEWHRLIMAQRRMVKKTSS